MNEKDTKLTNYLHHSSQPEKIVFLSNKPSEDNNKNNGQKAVNSVPTEKYNYYSRHSFNVKNENKKEEDKIIDVDTNNNEELLLSDFKKDKNSTLIQPDLYPNKQNSDSDFNIESKRFSSPLEKTARTKKKSNKFNLDEQFNNWKRSKDDSKVNVDDFDDDSYELKNQMVSNTN